ncbi:hypothetical protein [Xanthomonas sp. MUS 060]|nr:hypothetical protein [Xanthomonas sp. MUS 060]
MSPKKTSFPKQEIRVLLLEGISQTAIDTFRAAAWALNYRTVYLD